LKKEKGGNSMTDKAKIGIIGVGYIGEVHIGGVSASGKGEVVAIADVNEELLKSRQETYGIPSTYTDYNKMLETEKLDGVIIGTPDELHRGPVEAVAAAGLPMLLEKPIATTLEDAEAIVKAVEVAKVPCLMGFSLRFVSNYVALKQRFDSGDLGVPTTAYTKRSCTVDEARRLYGRCSVNEYLAVHDMDYLMWIFGKDVESIYTVKSDFRVYEEFETADHYWNLMQWKNGATASVFVTWGMPQGYPMYVEMEALMIGSKGSAHLNLGGQQTRIATDASFEIPELPLFTYTYREECGHFADVALGKTEAISDVYDGLNTYKLIAAADKSVETGQAVKVSL
jgi:UDP-N-acetylglucosamine 3-dehydrogenase